MLKSLGTEFKVGLFTLVALITLGYMFVMLGSEWIDSTEYKTYSTILSDAAGIIPKTQVKTNGLTVGRVKEVSLDRKTFSTRVVIEVDTKIEILTGSKIEVRTVGLLGDKFIEIVRSGVGVPIPDGGEIPESTESVDMQALISLVGDIAKDIKKVTTSLSNVLGTKDGENSIAHIVKNIEDMSSDFRQTAATFRAVLGDRDQDLHAIVTGIRAAIEDLREFSAGIKDVVNDENRAKVDRILAKFDISMDEVEGASKNIRLVSEKIEKGEGTIGKLLNDDETINELEAAIKDIRSVIAPAKKLQVGVDYYSEARFESETTAHYFNLRFQSRPDRFYLLGVVDPGIDYTTERTTDTYNEDPEDGAAAKTRETITEEHGLRYNAQISKRWYSIALRFGLFESTGGLAADWYLFGDKFRFSVEAFDWEIKDNPERRVAHIKAYANILFFNHVQVLAGINDPTRKEVDENGREKTSPLDWYLGAGLRFNDQDLKALFGTAALAASAN